MLTYTVPNMTCGGCAGAVRQALGDLPGIGKVEIDLPAKIVRVEPGTAQETAVRSAIEQAGFEIAA
ncbi:heavy-metal-associated domain-containing protein [Ferrovibrio sp. MS7]|uniref:heavy-metal-associated domain-containing protein n=1 Tax=Ferrovibrio plantarum TaxID=3119164 RepID=UPI003136BE91